MAGAGFFPFDLPHIQPQATLLVGADAEELATETQALPVRLVADMADACAHGEPLSAREVQDQQLEQLRAFDAHRLIGRQLDQTAAQRQVDQLSE